MSRQAETASVTLGRQRVMGTDATLESTSATWTRVGLSPHTEVDLARAAPGSTSTWNTATMTLRSARFHAHTSPLSRLELLSELNLELPCDPAIPPLGVRPAELEVSAQSRTVHSSQKVETTHEPINRQMDKQNVVHPYSGI